MGDCSAIVLTNSDDNLSNITIYGHWAGTTNLHAVRNVLSQPDAGIGDYSRLSAQMFYEFAIVLNGYTGGLGFRILTGTDEVWADNPNVIVNVDTGEYCVEGEETRYEYALPSVQAKYGQFLIESESI